MATEESNAPGLFPAIWRFRWSSLIIIVVVAALFGVGGYLLSPTITATSSVSLKNPSTTNVLAPNVTSDAATTRYIQQRADFFTSDQVLQQVLPQFPGKTISELRGEVSASATAGSNIVTVTARGTSAAAAAALSRDVVSAYRQVSQKLESDATATAVGEITANEDTVRKAQKSGTLGSAAASTTLAALQQQVNSLRTDSAVFGDGVSFVQAATAESASVPGLPIRELALGIIIGLVIAAIVAWLRADRHRRITRPARAEDVLGAPLLGDVTQVRRSKAAIGALTRPGSAGAAFGLDLRPEPRFGLAAAAVRRGQGNGVVVVLGPPESGDRSDAVLNIAMVLAGGGERVLVVDADPDAGLSRHLGAGSLEGFPASDGTGDGTPEIIRLSASDDIEFGLVAPGHSTSLQAVRTFVGELLESRDRFDVILVDAPALETSPLVPALVGAAAGILVTVPRGSDESAVADIRRTAEIFSTPIVGYLYTPGR